MKKINANCPVLECAVENKVDVCSLDCEKFLRDQFQNWPLSEKWIKIYYIRKDQINPNSHPPSYLQHSDILKNVRMFKKVKI